MQHGILVAWDGWAWWAALLVSVVRNACPHRSLGAPPAPCQVDERRVLAVDTAPPATVAAVFGALGAGVLGRRRVVKIVRTLPERWLRCFVSGRSSRGRGGSTTASLGRVVGGDQVGEGDLGGASKGPWAGRRQDSEVPRPRPVMTRFQSSHGLSRVGLNRAAVPMSPPHGPSVPVLAACLEENAAGLGPIWRWRCEGSGHGSQTPLLDVCLDEHKSSLAKVDMDDGGTVGADSGEEVGRLEPVYNILQPFPVASEKDCARPGSVTDADDIPLHDLRAVRGRVEWLIVPARAAREICHRVLVEAWEKSALGVSSRGVGLWLSYLEV